jgi:hypothetical protein
MWQGGYGGAPAGLCPPPWPTSAHAVSVCLLRSCRPARWASTDAREAFEGEQRFSCWGCCTSRCRASRVGTSCAPACMAGRSGFAPGRIFHGCRCQHVSTAAGAAIRFAAGLCIKTRAGARASCSARHRARSAAPRTRQARVRRQPFCPALCSASWAVACRAAAQGGACCRLARPHSPSSLRAPWHVLISVVAPRVAARAWRRSGEPAATRARMLRARERHVTAAPSLTTPFHSHSAPRCAP